MLRGRSTHPRHAQGSLLWLSVVVEATVRHPVHRTGQQADRPMAAVRGSSAGIVL